MWRVRSGMYMPAESRETFLTHCLNVRVEEQVDVKHSDDEDFGPSVFSWRKQVTKWDWYEAVRRRELGRVDSHSEEQTSVSSSALQMSAVYVDCQSLAQSLQELPLHLRLNWSSFPLHQFCNPS
ncbi:cell death regulator Aven-like isoform X2 [Polyodon spathula]|uniref:cell death regulator Aven-like isoform X2 n=1 Tax=Polyodon spathula TaxID=7913 RepID=UPI001B7F6562|nr:cell death regulator Aven-like isoform X2 [Polyodon spathula]